MQTSPEVIHETKACRFAVLYSEGDAEITYQVESGVMVISHTFVPPALRGKGIAETLARSALTWASQANLRVVPHCSYVARFIDRHPEFKSLLGNEI